MATRLSGFEIHDRANLLQRRQSLYAIHHERNAHWYMAGNSRDEQARHHSHDDRAPHRAWQNRGRLRAGGITRIFPATWIDPVYTGTLQPGQGAVRSAWHKVASAAQLAVAA